MINKFLRSVSHANIVTIFEYGWLADNQCYYDMEFCYLNLTDYIANEVYVSFGLSKYFEPRSANENLGCLSLWGIMKHIVAGLDFIHLHGELHRDLKPQNGDIQHAFSC